jgi:Exopolysaccharide biosynthesis protein YbjH
MTSFSFRAFLLAGFSITLFNISTTSAEPNLMGETGLIAMPDANVEPLGTWRIGYSVSNPYAPLYTSLTPVPRLEFSGRFMRIKDSIAFPGEDFGDNKDREFDLKFQLLTEGKFWPNLALGIQDTFGTRIFAAEYAVASKRYGPLDVTIGYGRKRINGAFGGIRYFPTEKKNIALVAEYDANNYARDYGSDVSGADKRSKGVAYGLEYNWGWLGAQLSRQKGGQNSGNVHISIPLETPDFIPKLTEPEPYTKITVRPSYDQWQSEKIHKNRMARALYEDDFTNIAIRSTGPDLFLNLSNSRISDLPRAVGRAARISALLSPMETKRIFITYTLIEMPSVTYEFNDLNQLQRYFNGQISRKALSASVNITYPPGGPVNQGYNENDLYLGLDDDQPGLKTVFNDDGDLISLKRTDTLLNRIKIAPKFGLLLDDPSGAFRYNAFISADYTKNLGKQFFLEGVVDWTFAEDISKARAPNNSVLPHVRSDFAKYKKDSKFKLASLLLNKYFHPGERVYARGSAGIYEEMFGGVGGQVLYLTKSGNFSTDLSVDWVKQRDTKGLFGFQPYATTTAIVSTRYLFPYGVTGTVRAGRFLAKDEGARFEIKRRFTSGFEMGTWYTRTNGNDLNASGNVGKPYYDKGVFMSIPLGTLLTKDSQAIAPFSIAPWTRDVGQMVASPGDLYGMVERPLVLGAQNRDGLAKFGDVEDNY